MNAVIAAAYYLIRTGEQNFAATLYIIGGRVTLRHVPFAGEFGGEPLLAQSAFEFLLTARLQVELHVGFVFVAPAALLAFISVSS